jgi:putative ABC transport system substrate-binding protein
MRRRDFIKVVAGSAITRPLAARAQQLRMPVIGFLSAASPPTAPLVAFRQALNDFGYVEGKNVAIDARLSPQ